MPIKIIKIKHPTCRPGTIIEIEEKIRIGRVVPVDDYVYIHNQNGVAFAICKNKTARFWDRFFDQEVKVILCRELFNDYPVALLYDDRIEILDDKEIDMITELEAELKYWRKYSSNLEVDVIESRIQIERMKHDRY